MKKAAGFAVILIAAFLFIQVFALKYVGTLEDDGYLVTNDVKNTLSKGTENREKMVALLGAERHEQVYRRAGNYYVGEDRERIEEAYPMLIGGGMRVRFLNDSATLIADDLETRLSSYEGLYMSDGISFLNDGDQADVETFVLIGLSNGIYMNASAMTLEYDMGKSDVRMNSFVYFGEDVVRWYSLADGKLQYGEFTALTNATIRIGDLYMGYQAFWEKLNGIGDSSTLPPSPKTDGEEEKEPGEGQVISGDGAEIAGDAGNSENRSDGSYQEGKKTSSGEKDASGHEDSSGSVRGGSSGKDDAAGSSSGNDEGSGKDSGSGSGSSQGSSSGSSGSGSGSGSGAGQGLQNGDGGQNGTAGDDVSEEQDNGTEDEEGEDDGGEGEIGNIAVKVEKPVVTIGDFKADIYNITNQLNITDNYGVFVKASFELYWDDGSGRKVLKLRKSSKRSGDLDLKVVPPDTEILIKATYTYYDSLGVKVEEALLPEEGVTVKTRPLSDLSPLESSFEYEEVLPRLSNQIQIQDLQIQIPEDTAAYVNSLVVTVKNAEGEEKEIELENIYLNALKRGDAVDWTSSSRLAEFIKSDASYTFTISLQDKFGNEMPLRENGSSERLTYLGPYQVTTCKVEPTVQISENKSSEDIGMKEIVLRLSDPDGADFTAYTTSDSMELPEIYLAVYQIIDGEDVQILLDDTGGFYTDQGLEVIGNRFLGLAREQMMNSGGQTLQVTGLTAGVNYRFKILGNYDINDGNGVCNMKEIGESLMNAMPISRLGYGYGAFSTANVDDRSVDAIFRLNTAKTNVLLNEWFGEFGLGIYEGSGTSRPVYETFVCRDDMGLGNGLDNLSSVVIDTAGRYVLSAGSDTTPAISLTGTQVRTGTTAWDAILAGAGMEISFPDRYLKSNTTYTMSMTTIAYQGGVKHNISSPGNSATFRTLKLEPEIIWSDAYTISDFIEFRDFVIYDPDGAITGNVTIYLMSEGSTVKTWVVTPQKDDSITIPSKRFDGLKSDTTYYLRYYADSYNQSSSGSGAVTNKELDSTHGRDGQRIQNTFTTGAGIVGSLELLSLDNLLEGMETSAGSNQLYDADDIETGIYISDTKGVFTASTSWWTTGYIPVSEGDLYLLSDWRTTSDYRVAFYSDKIEETDSTTEAAAKVVGPGCYHIYQSTEWNQNAVVQAPAGARYMRISTVTGTNIYLPKVMNLSSMGKAAQLFQNYEYSYGELYERNSNQFVNEGGDFERSKSLNANGQIINASSTQGISAKIHASEGDIFLKCGGYQSSGKYIAFFDSNDTVLSVQEFNTGQTAKAPADTSYFIFSDLYAYLDPSSSRETVPQKASVRKLHPTGMKTLLDKDDAMFQAEIQVNLKDPGQSLRNYNYYELKWYKEEGTDGTDSGTREYREAVNQGRFTIPLTGDGLETLDVQDVFTENLEAQCSYRVEIYIRLKDYDILLDSLEFETTGVTYSIKNDREMAKLAADPAGNFRIIADFESSYTGMNSSSIQFTGTLDGQGHTITRTTTTRIFYDTGTETLIENLVINWSNDLTGYIYDKESLVYRNYGTIRNVVLHLNLRGNYENRVFGGLVYSNYGTVENFVIHYESTLYVRDYFGGVCRLNYGTVQNGYSYGQTLQVTSGNYLGNPNTDHNHVGNLIGEMYSGAVAKNLFVLNDMNTEQGTGMQYNGLVVGYNSNGMVQDCFTCGNHYYYKKENGVTQFSGQIYKNYGPVVGTFSTVGLELSDDLYYISDYEYSGKNQSPAEPESLWNEDWYYELFNDEKEEKFNILTQIANGYYPTVKMPDCMAETQENISLPVMYGKSYPDLIGVKVNTEGVDEDGRAYQEVTLSFSNSRRRKIMSMDITGLMCDINTETQRMEGSNYLVDAVLRIPDEEEARSNRPLYRSSYEVTHLNYQISALNQTFGDLYYGDDTEFGRRTLSVEFYKQLRTVADWESIDDYGGNYHVDADIDFGWQIGKALDAQTFTGILDGGIYDGNGNLTGVHTISNMYISPNGYLIQKVEAGTVQNLRFSNISFDRTLSTVESTGLIQYAGAQTILKNLQLNQIRMDNITRKAGTLAGRGYYADISYCYVTDSQLSTALADGRSLIVGGLLGELERCSVKNCFARNVQIDASEGYDSNGIGGLIGRTVTGGTVESCYAEGTISGSLSQVGGLVGRSGCSVSRVWTSVSITSAASQLGGIAGVVDVSSTIRYSMAAGEIYSKGGSTDNIGCIYGAEMNGATVTLNKAYGYEGQMINGQAPLEIEDFDMHASGILKASQIQGSTAATYWKKTVNIGSAFLVEQSADYPEPTEEGSLPWLLSEDGVTPMPDQETVYPKDISLQIVLGTHAKNSVTGKYEIGFSVKYAAGSSYTVQEIILEGMDMGTAADGSGQRTEGADGTTISYMYNAMDPISYLDVYRLSVILQRDGENSTQTISAMVDFGSPIYREIPDAATWQEVMRTYGSSYENFRITGDIDFTGITSPQINVKANRVTAAAGCRIMNLSYTAQSASDALFADITAGIDSLGFENIIWTNPNTGGMNVGLIGKSQGQVKNLTFKNISVSAIKGTNVGCIGSGYGSIDSIKMDNVVVTNTGSYTGGLVGYSLGDIKNVSLTGTATSADSYGSRITGGTTSGCYYTGGIVGLCDGTLTDLSVDQASVTGYQYVGGICGNMPQQTENANLTVGSLSTTRTYAVMVSGTTIVGGVVGGSATGNEYGCWNYRKLTNVNTYRTYVNGTGDYIGGIDGRYTGVYDSTVVYPTVSGRNYVGGISGYYSEEKNCQVIGETVLDDDTGEVTDYRSRISGSSYVGGISGYAWGLHSQCQVYGMEIDGSQYVGGIQAMSGHSGANYCIVNQCSIGSSVSKYVGGISGGEADNHTATMAYQAVLNTKIRAHSYGGGIIGRKSEAFTAHDLYADVDVIVETEYAGAFAGEALTYSRPSTSDIYDKLYNAYFTGTVRAGGNYAGGIVGCLTKGAVPLDGEGNLTSTAVPPDGFTEEYYYNILCAVDVSGGNNSLTGYYGVSRTAGGADERAGKIGNLYLYEGATRNGTPAPGSSDYTKVSTKTMSDEDFWTGQLKFTTNYWDFKGLEAIQTNGSIGIIPDGGSGLDLYVENLSGTKVVTLSSNNYVQDDSLILWLDGINNTGSGHSRNAAAWTNMAGTDGESYLLKNFTTMSWESDGLVFNGTNNYLDLISNSDLGVDFTVSAMIKPSEAKSGLIWGRYDGDAGGLALLIPTSKNVFSFYINSGSGSGWSFGSLNDSNWEDWVQVTVSVSTDPDTRKATVRFYVNGVQTGATRTYNNMDYLNNDMRLGGGGWYNSISSSWNFKGKIGNFMVYNRTLSDSEIESNYRADASRFYDGTASTAEGSIVKKDSVPFTDGKATIQLNNSDFETLGLNGSRSSRLFVVVEQADGANSIGGAVAYPKTADTVSVASSCPNLNPDGTVTGNPTVTVSTMGNYQWYFSTQPGYSGVPLAGETDASLKLEGNGYYYCKVIDSSGAAGYSRIYQRTGPSYMPYIRYSTTSATTNYGTLPTQEGFYKAQDELGKGTRDYPYSMTDDVSNGGVPIPGTDTATASYALMRSMMMADEEIPQVTAYASGVNTLNLEFDDHVGYLDPSFFSSCYFTVETDGEEVFRSYIENRVYTLTYNFLDDLTVRIVNENTGEEEVTEFAAEDLVRNVMTWDNEYAYLTQNGLRSSTMEEALEGSYVNLFGGYALAADGRVLSLAEEGTAEDCLTQEIEWYTQTELRPLQQGAYTLDGAEVSLKTFAGFTAVTQEGQTSVKKQQIFVKNGQVFLSDASWNPVPDGLILDTYQASRYMTILIRDGYLEDMEHPITLPDNFQNYGIAQISNTLDSTGHLVLIRYNSGKVVGFNYLTGTVLNIEQDEIVTDFVVYAQDWLQARFFGSFKVSADNYTESTQLTSAILLHPVEAAEEETDGWGTDADHAYDGDTSSLDTEGINDTFATEDVPIGSGNEEATGGTSETGGVSTAALEEEDTSGSGVSGTADEEPEIPGQYKDSGQEDTGSSDVTVADATESTYTIDGVESSGGITGIYQDETLSNEPSYIYTDEYEEGDAGAAYKKSESAEEAENDNRIMIAPVPEGTGLTSTSDGISSSMIVYNADKKEYEVYDVAALLTGDSLEEVESVQEQIRKLSKNGISYDYVELVGSQSGMNEKQERGFIYLLLAVSGAGVLLIGLYLVRRRNTRRK